MSIKFSFLLVHFHCSPTRLQQKWLFRKRVPLQKSSEFAQRKFSSWLQLQAECAGVEDKSLRATTFRVVFRVLPSEWKREKYSFVNRSAKGEKAKNKEILSTQSQKIPCNKETTYSGQKFEDFPSLSLTWINIISTEFMDAKDKGKRSVLCGVNSMRTAPPL